MKIPNRISLPEKKPNNKKEIIQYLKNHFRYNTMSSWNGVTSYANQIKAHRIDATREETKQIFEMLNVENSFNASGFNEILKEFSSRHHHEYKIGANGRSGGYLVLYHSKKSKSEHKSICTNCGQKNFKEATEQNKICGVCHNPTRVSYQGYNISVFTGLSLDEDESFEEWGSDQLKSRRNLIWDFDKTCNKAVNAYVDYAKNNQVQETVVLVPQTISMAVSR